MSCYVYKCLDMNDQHICTCYINQMGMGEGWRGEYVATYLLRYSYDGGWEQVAGGVENMLALFFHFKTSLCMHYQLLNFYDTTAHLNLTFEQVWLELIKFI